MEQEEKKMDEDIVKEGEGEEDEQKEEKEEGEKEEVDRAKFDLWGDTGTGPRVPSQR